MTSRELSSSVVPSGVVTSLHRRVRPGHDSLPWTGRTDAVGTPLVDVDEPARGTAAEPMDEADTGRGTPLQALAGWGAALVLGAAFWAGALAILTRLV